MRALGAWVAEQRRRGNLLGPLMFAVGLVIFASRPLWQVLALSIALAGVTVGISKWELRTPQRKERMEFAVTAVWGIFYGGFGVLVVLTGPFIIEGWGEKLLLVLCGSMLIAVGLPGLASILDRRSPRGSSREEVAEEIQAIYLRTVGAVCAVPVALVGLLEPGGGLIGRLIVLSFGVWLGFVGVPALRYWRTRFGWD